MPTITDYGSTQVENDVPQRTDITEKMIEAGRKVFYDEVGDDNFDDSVLVAVFRAMEAARAN